MGITESSFLTVVQSSAYIYQHSRTKPQQPIRKLDSHRNHTAAHHRHPCSEKTTNKSTLDRVNKQTYCHSRQIQLRECDHQIKQLIQDKHSNLKADVITVVQHCHSGHRSMFVTSILNRLVSLPCQITFYSKAGL